VSRVADWIDGALEVTVAGSFTRLGYAARRRLDHWGPDPDGTGRVCVLTGGTAGLGLAAARRLRATGATVVILGRDPEKTAAVAASIGALPLPCDLGDLDAVRAAGAALVAQFPQIDVLLHNAGALDATWSASPQGIERTLATHVVGPWALTAACLPRMTAGARVIWVSSGGMYTEPLDLAQLESPPTDYDGVRAYARAKRAQVTLAAMLAEHLAPQGIDVHAMHPGWADTPGVARSLPTFRRIVGAALRTPDQGADTMVWLASTRDRPPSGRFWLDRRARSIHRTARTRASDTPEARAALWAWVHARAGRPAGLPDAP
jgi:NAD(P)-dependent dehydrogenase (short-subunit alcohol dehydrogenase family)